jgi:hypothetical protein
VRPSVVSFEDRPPAHETSTSYENCLELGMRAILELDG